MQPDNQPNQPPDTNPPAPSDPPIPQTTDEAAPASSQSAAVPPVSAEKPKSKNPKAKLFAVVAAAAVIILGGSAAAYFGVYVPNQPENVLKTALENTAKEKQAKFEGKLGIDSTGSDPFAATVDFSGQGDLSKGSAQTTLDVTVSGVKLKLDAMIVDSAVYVKVGDLSSIKGLASMALPGSEAIIEEANKKIADQWIEIDETLLKTVKADCALGLTKSSFTDQDVQLLMSNYEKTPFATIKSTSSEDVNGKAATKFELELDDNKAAEYAKGLNELSILKKIKECDESADTLDTKDLADNNKTPLTLWVDKSSKLITKVATETTKKYDEESQIKGSLNMTIDYSAVQITKPDKSRPLMEVLGELGSLSQGLTPGAM